MPAYYYRVNHERTVALICSRYERNETLIDSSPLFNDVMVKERLLRYDNNESQPWGL